VFNVEDGDGGIANLDSDRAVDTLLLLLLLSAAGVKTRHNHGGGASYEDGNAAAALENFILEGANRQSKVTRFLYEESVVVWHAVPAMLFLLSLRLL
jgi:hypothetical protein